MFNVLLTAAISFAALPDSARSYARHVVSTSLRQSHECSTSRWNTLPAGRSRRSWSRRSPKRLRDRPESSKRASSGGRINAGFLRRPPRSAGKRNGDNPARDRTAKMPVP